tara:strand:+ start:110 stop:427 length:318 start_codon:yes stop_codon:yes gene_type:complete
MSRYITLGTYTNQGAAGLVDGDSDRRAAMDVAHSSVGAKLVDYHITRGQYDFCVIADADSFAVIAAMGLKAKGSGAIDKLVTLESVDIEEVRSVAKNVQFTPPST